MNKNDYRENLGYRYECDIWSWGVVLCEMIGGYNPFYNADMMIQYENIVKANINWPKNIDAESRDLLSKGIFKNEPEILNLKD
jgi:protein kinase A